MGVYEMITLVGGLSYLPMFPTVLAIPQLWQMILFEPDEAMTAEVMISIEALFLQLTVVVAIGFLLAYYLNSVVYQDVTVIQRMFIVSTCVGLTALLGQDPFPDYHFCFLMTAFDVIGGVAHGLAAPGGLAGVWDRFWKHWRNKPNTPKKMALRVDSYIGLFFGFVALVYAAIMPPNRDLSIMTTMVSIPIQYLWFWYAAHDQGDKSMGPVLFTRILFGASCLYITEVYGILVLPLRMQAAALPLGLANPYLSAVSNALSTVYLYYVMTAHVLTVENGPIYWLIGWGAVTWISSEGWIWLFYNDYDNKQKARVLRTNWQDRILSVFEIAAGGALAKAGHLAPGTVGEAVVYLLPPVTLWFTLETKMLSHMQVGTPFHPTWWVDGDLPKFSKTDYVNVSFGIATALITIILTSYAFYAVTAVIGFSAFSFDETSLWKFAAAHGITFVFHSGIWMIVASSGVPEVGAQKMFQLFPPPLPPFVRANPHDCVPMHKVDLVIGNGLLVLAAFALNDGVLGEAEEKAFKTVVFILWGLCTANKLRIHYNGWGYVDPVTAGKVKKN